MLTGSSPEKKSQPIKIVKRREHEGYPLRRDARIYLGDSKFYQELMDVTEGEVLPKNFIPH